MDSKMELIKIERYVIVDFALTILSAILNFISLC